MPVPASLLVMAPLGLRLPGPGAPRQSGRKARLHRAGPARVLLPARVCAAASGLPQRGTGAHGTEASRESWLDDDAFSTVEAVPAQPTIILPPETSGSWRNIFIGVGTPLLARHMELTPMQSSVALVMELFLISLTAAGAAFVTVRLDEERQIMLRRGTIRRRMETDWAKALIQESKQRVHGSAAGTVSAAPADSSTRQHIFLDDNPGPFHQHHDGDGASRPAPLFGAVRAFEYARVTKVAAHGSAGLPAAAAHADESTMSRAQGPADATAAATAVTAALGGATAARPSSPASAAAGTDIEAPTKVAAPAAAPARPNAAPAVSIPAPPPPTPPPPARRTSPSPARERERERSLSPSARSTGPPILRDRLLRFEPQHSGGAAAGAASASGIATAEGQHPRVAHSAARPITWGANMLLQRKPASGPSSSFATGGGGGGSSGSAGGNRGSLDQARRQAREERAKVDARRGAERRAAATAEKPRTPKEIQRLEQAKAWAAARQRAFVLEELERKAREANDFALGTEEEDDPAARASLEVQQAELAVAIAAAAAASAAAAAAASAPRPTAAKVHAAAVPVAAAAVGAEAASPKLTDAEEEVIQTDREAEEVPAPAADSSAAIAVAAAEAAAEAPEKNVVTPPIAAAPAPAPVVWEGRMPSPEEVSRARDGAALAALSGASVESFGQRQRRMREKQRLLREEEAAKAAAASGAVAAAPAAGEGQPPVEPAQASLRERTLRDLLSGMLPASATGAPAGAAAIAAAAMAAMATVAGASSRGAPAVSSSFGHQSQRSPWAEDDGGAVEEQREELSAQAAEAVAAAEEVAEVVMSLETASVPASEASGAAHEALQQHHRLLLAEEEALAFEAAAAVSEAAAALDAAAAQAVAEGVDISEQHASSMHWYDEASSVKSATTSAAWTSFSATADAPPPANASPDAIVSLSDLDLEAFALTQEAAEEAERALAAEAAFHSAQHSAQGPGELGWGLVRVEGSGDDHEGVFDEEAIGLQEREEDEEEYVREEGVMSGGEDFFFVGQQGMESSAAARLAELLGSAEREAEATAARLEWLRIEQLHRSRNRSARTVEAAREQADYLAHATTARARSHGALARSVRPEPASAVGLASSKDDMRFADMADEFLELEESVMRESPYAR